MSYPLTEDTKHILTHTKGIWDGLRGQQIFITGGTGFFGYWLVESFLLANDQFNLGAKVVLLTRNADAFIGRIPHLAKNPAVSLLQGDVRTFDFPTGRFPFVIHAAAETGARQTKVDPLHMFATNVEGTRHTLEFAHTHGTCQFLLTSSGAVYGKQPLGMTHIPEDYLGAPDPMDMNSTYGESKRVAEMLCSHYAHQFGLETKIARCFAFVGPHLQLDTGYAIGNFIRDACRGGPVKVNDGSPLRSYLYASDLAIWLWTILFRGKPCFPYNVGSERSISIADVADMVCKISGSGMEMTIARHANYDSYPEPYVPSTSRARGELGLENWIPLEESIKRTIKWSKSNLNRENAHTG